MNIINNYDKVIADIKNVCALAGTDAAKVHLLLVTKYASVEQIALLLSQRKVDFIAESRLQESLVKWSSPQLADFKVKKFFIGRLQKNKVAKILRNFDVICSLDDTETAKVVNDKAAEAGKKADCFLQVKITDSQTQGGAGIEQAPELIKYIRSDLKNINLTGIMAIAPIAENPQDLAPLFEKVKKLFNEHFTEGDYLSLGMSGDYKTAVEHGSNLPRIGSAVFG